VVKNKVVIVLKSLSAEEIRQLDKFVKSPVHNRHEDVVRLFQYLRKHLNGTKESLEKERVYESLFPKTPFDMQKVHYISSYLLKVVEEFLAWKAWRSNDVSFGLSLMKSYNAHRLEQAHKSSLNWTQEQHQTQPQRDAPHYLQSYQLYAQEYLAAKAMGRTKDFNLQQLIDAQDIAFIIDKLKNGCNALSLQPVNNTKYEMGLLSATLDFLKGHHYLEIPSVAMYFNAYMALSDLANEAAFLELKQLLAAHPTVINTNDLKDLYLFTINYCIKQLNSGNQSYLSEVFELYQSGLSVDIFMENGEFSPWTYSNFIISGLKLREYDRVETFIQKYTSALPEKQRDGLYRYNYAFLHYEKKNYQQAMVLLSTTDYGKDLLTACAAKTLLARMYYEQEEIETLQNLLQSFKLYISRKELLGYHRDSYGNFIATLSKLMQARLSKKTDHQELTKEIGNFRVVAAKDWLLEQAKKLK
jgi:hypothetical protein